MDHQHLNKICFTICIICIVMGTVLSLAMIWVDLGDNAVLWKAWLTILVFFIASGMTLIVSKAIGGRAKHKEE